MFGSELQGRLIGHLKWSPTGEYIAAALDNIINIWPLKKTDGTNCFGNWFIEDIQEFITALSWPKYAKELDACKNYLLVGKIDGSVSLITVGDDDKESEILQCMSQSRGKYRSIICHK